MLLEPEGKSIVSDIDDTIKVSEIPRGRRSSCGTRFLRISRLKVCGTGTSVWEMSPSITCPVARGSFLGFCTGSDRTGGFPARHVSHEKLEDQPARPAELHRGSEEHGDGKNATKEQKIRQISALMDNLRHRQFTLIGDSGELDPEVFTELRKTRGAQIEKMVIRDVVDARHHAPQRLHAVDEIIDVPAIRRGMSQFT